MKSKIIKFLLFALLIVFIVSALISMDAKKDITKIESNDCSGCSKADTCKDAVKSEQ